MRNLDASLANDKEELRLVLLSVNDICLRILSLMTMNQPNVTETRTGEERRGEERGGEEQGKGQAERKGGERKSEGRRGAEGEDTFSK